MIIEYKNKKDKQTILDSPANISLKFVNGNKNSGNKLIKGNNLSVMKILDKDYGLAGKVDMVYIDPPFSTNTIFYTSEERTATVSFSKKDDIAYQDHLKGSDFIEFLRERIILIRELLSDTGSMYLHIDYKIGHYVKIMMDEIFGYDNFRNDITRIKCNPKNFQRKAYSNVKDMILFYTKSKHYVWNEPKEKMSSEEINKLFNKTDKNGKKYTTNPLHAPGETLNGKSGQKWKNLSPPKGRHWRYAPEVLDELDAKGLIEWSKNGVPRKIIFADDYGTKRVQDVWEYKDSQTVTYPTEKNLDLLKLIINTSSNEGQLVFDGFCGSGTTLYASAILNRHWIGIDSSTQAIKATKNKLAKHDDYLFRSYFDYSYWEET